MMPQRHIYAAGFRCGKTHYLAERARAALHLGLAPANLLALAPHRTAAQGLREALRAATGRDLPAATLRRRAMAILETTPEAARLPAGWSPSALLSGIDRRLLMRRAWLRAGAHPASLFATRGDSPGALDWVAHVFDLWSSWCGTADPARLQVQVSAAPPLAELWQAYRHYLALCQELGVVAFNEVFGRALDALEQPAVRAAHTPRLLLLDDLDLFRPDELLFAERLIGAETAVHATTTAELDAGSPLAQTRFTAAWAARLQLAPVADERAAEPPRLDIAQYATPDDEVRAIAAQITALRGTATSSLAIVAFDPELPALLRRTLPQYGVPVEGAEARDGYTLALAPLALAGLKLLAGQAPTAHETIALLRQPALGLDPADAHATISAVEHTHFQPFAAGATSRWPDTLGDAGRRRIAEISGFTSELAAQGGPPSRRLERWLDELGIAAAGWERTAAALEPWAVELDRRHWERLLGFLRQSEALRAALEAPLTPDEAVDVWSSALALIEPEGKPQSGAVEIWRPEELGGCSADVVWLAGLHESTLPRAAQALPLADEAALADAFAALPGFVPPEIADRAAAWERGAQLLHRAISRGHQAAHLSYSAASVDGRRRLPSLLVRELLAIPADRHGALMIAPDLQPAEELQPAPLPPSAAEIRLIEPSRERPAALRADSSAELAVSPSAIEDYFNCPRRCFYARELQLWDVASSPRQALGHVVHNAVHDLLRDAAVLPLSVAHGRSLVADHWIHDEQRWGSRLKQAVFRQLAEEALANVVRYETEQGTGGASYAGGEFDIEWRLPDANALIRGRVDRIDRRPDGLAIVDYKLGRHNKSIKELLAEFVRPRDAGDEWRPADIQLPLYVLAVEQGTANGFELRPGERVTSVAQIYPLDLYTATGRLSSRGVREIRIVDHASPCPACEQPANDLRAGTVCREQLAGVAALVRAAIDEMRAGAWQPAPREGSKTCGSCNFRPICSDPQ